MSSLISWLVLGVTSLAGAAEAAVGWDPVGVTKGVMVERKMV